jgi:uncharacterized protein YlzI (FlbEa/FlbD family)
VTPDTLISLTNGQKLVVLESADEVVGRVVEYRRAIFSGLLQCTSRDLRCADARKNPDNL